MAAESWVLDGIILNGGNFTLRELTADPPRERQNWITAADTESAALFRQPLHENRTITLKLLVSPQSSMNAALGQVGTIVDKLRKASSTTAGVPLVWTPGSASLSVTFTVLTGEITGLPISLADEGLMWMQQRPVINIELTCQPYGVGARVVYGSTATTSTPFQVLELASIPGDIDALGELIVTDAATQSRRHVEWGLEGPLTYNSATSLLVDSDDMVTSGFSGAQATTTGAYDPNASGNNSVNLTLVAGTTTAIAGTGNLSHVGVFRVKARVQSGSLSNSFRLSWKALDGPMNHNAWVLPISTSDWQELDLGTITIPAATLGTQRWTGQIEIAAATSSPGTAVVDYLVLIPQADGYGVARAAYSYATGIATGYDAFVGTTAGVALGVRAAPLGGSWATSGDATDFAFADQFITGDTVESIIRSTAAAETNGRFAILGSTSYTDSQVDVRAKFSAGTFNQEQAVILRWTDSSNYLRLVVTDNGTSSDTAKIEQVVAGVVTVIASQTFNWGTFAPDDVSLGSRYRMRLIAYASGRVLGYMYSNDASTLLLTLDGSSTAVASGGTLATGKPGLRDRATSASGPINRYFTQFAVSTPAAEPIAIYSGRNIQIRYDDTLRQDSTGTYAGRPSSYNGSRFLLPAGTSRILAKARRSDIVTATDANVTDSTTIQVAYTPRYLAVPR
jgi:hypothetical protein